MIIPYTDEYIADVERMARRMHDESDMWRDMPMDIPKGLRSAHCLFLHRAGGRVDGMIAGVILTYWFCDVKMANNLIFYVEPEKRGSRAAMELVLTYEKWAVGQGIKSRDIWITQDSAIGTGNMVSFCERMGYENVGANCRKVT
jgi:GNAT superfamily N-acetyltransferase